MATRSTCLLLGVFMGLAAAVEAEDAPWKPGPADLSGPVRLPIEQPEPSPSRTKKEIEAVLTPPPVDAKLKPLHLVLVAGKKDHGPGSHDYPAWQKAWYSLLSRAKAVTVSVAWEWPDASQFEKADVMIFFKKGSWKDPAQMDRYVERGGGLVFLHWAVNGGEEAAKWCGLGWGKGSRYRHGAVDLALADRDHPILAGLRGRTLKFYDEAYWALKGDPAGLDVLGTSKEEGEPRPLFWTKEIGKGRSVTCILGHYNDSFNDPLLRLIVFRAINWTARQPADRFHDIVSVEVKYKIP